MLWLRTLAECKLLPKTRYIASLRTEMSHQSLWQVSCFLFGIVMGIWMLIFDNSLVSGRAQDICDRRTDAQADKEKRETEEDPNVIGAQPTQENRVLKRLKITQDKVRSLGWRSTAWCESHLRRWSSALVGGCAEKAFGHRSRHSPGRDRRHEKRPGQRRRIQVTLALVALAFCSLPGEYTGPPRHGQQGWDSGRIGSEANQSENVRLSPYDEAVFDFHRWSSPIQAPGGHERDSDIGKIDQDRKALVVGARLEKESLG